MQRFGLLLPGIAMLTLSQLLTELLGIGAREHLHSWLQRTVLVFVIAILAWSAIVIVHFNQTPLRHRHRYILPGYIVLSFSVGFLL